jgi:hypothetical protein
VFVCFISCSSYLIAIDQNIEAKALAAWDDGTDESSRVRAFQILTYHTSPNRYGIYDESYTSER